MKKPKQTRKPVVEPDTIKCPNCGNSKSWTILHMTLELSGVPCTRLTKSGDGNAYDDTKAEYCEGWDTCQDGAVKCNKCGKEYDYSDLTDLRETSVDEEPDGIVAEAHSDDRVIEVVFDALPWFKKASFKEIQALVDCDFGGDYPADAVAEALVKNHLGLKGLFRYLDAVSHTPKATGFEVHINREQAEAWIRANRPKVRLDK
jgi:hypothetical protein